MSAPGSTAWSPFVLAGLLVGAGLATLRLRVEERGPFRPPTPPAGVLQSPQIKLMPPPPPAPPTTRPAAPLAAEEARAEKAPADGLVVVFRRDGGAPAGGGLATLSRAADGAAVAAAEIRDGRADFAGVPAGEELRLRAAFAEPAFADLDVAVAPTRPARGGAALVALEPATRPVLRAMFHHETAPASGAAGVLRWRTADASPGTPFSGMPIVLNAAGEIRAPAPPPGSTVHVLLWPPGAPQGRTADAYFDELRVPLGAPRDVSAMFRRLKPPPIRFAGVVIGAPRDEPGEATLRIERPGGARFETAPVDRRGRFVFAGVDDEGPGLLGYRHPRLAATTVEAPDGAPDVVLRAAPAARVYLDVEAPPELGARLALRAERTDARTARERVATPAGTRIGEGRRYRLAVDGLAPGVYDVVLVDGANAERPRHEFQRVTLAPGEERALLAGVYQASAESDR